MIEKDYKSVKIRQEQLQLLLRVANNLDTKGLYVLANKVDDLIREVTSTESNTIDSILGTYKTIHMASLYKKSEDDLAEAINILFYVLQHKMKTVDVRTKLGRAAKIVTENNITPTDIHQAIVKWGLSFVSTRQARKHVKKAIEDLQRIKAEREKRDQQIEEYEERQRRSSSLKVVGEIRKNSNNPCPFGLPITKGCQTAGDSVLLMETNGDVEKNTLIYQRQATQLPCIYAKKILEQYDAVDCDYGTTTQGRAVPKLYRSSPIYPKLWEGFNTVNLSRNFHQYHDFNYFSVYG